MRFTYEELQEMINVLTIATVRLQDSMNEARRAEFDARLRILNSAIDKLEIKLLNH